MKNQIKWIVLSFAAIMSCAIHAATKVTVHTARMTPQPPGYEAGLDDHLREKAQRMIIAPTCLLKQVSIPYTQLASSHDLSLIETNSTSISQLIITKLHSKKIGCGGFEDVTYSWQVFKQNTHPTDPAIFLNNYVFPKKPPVKKYGIHFQRDVYYYFTQYDPVVMWNNLNTLTLYEDRYADSDTGVAATNWIKNQIEEMVKQSHRHDVTISFIPTGTDYKQSSLVVKFGNSNEPGIVIGAHIDTVRSDWEGFKPGADDDGSGAVTVLEAARTLIMNHAHFRRPIYFIWYAAEEEGSIGSEYVVDQFVRKNIPIDAVIQFDLTGYAYPDESTLWLMTDHVDSDLTHYLKQLIDTYLNKPVKFTRCGYACSDHARWTDMGFAAAMPAETEMRYTNPNIHHPTDTTDKLSLLHMCDYLRLALAFAVELAEPVETTTSVRHEQIFNGAER